MMLSVTVYSTGGGCMQCELTRTCLRGLGIEFTEIDLSDEANHDALQYVTEDLGYSQAPVVAVDGDSEFHWSGFQPALIKRLAERHTAGDIVREVAS